MNAALDRQMERWYPLKDHPVQLALVAAVSTGIRFPVVPAGRRSGKTERAKRFVAKQAMTNPNEKYFLAAPTRAQAKKIFWQDIKLLTLSACHPKPPGESELIVFLPNGTEIHVLGLDKPARFEGTNWTGGVIDEIADIKEDSIDENIMPALDTVDPRRPDYRAWCWFIGVPDGLGKYYRMATYAEFSGDELWELFHWKSAEILPADVIDAAKRRMSKRQFQQEYEGSFETATGKIYEDYNKENATDTAILPHEEIHWMHDQNYTPLSSAIGVIREDSLYLLDEIVLISAISRQSAMEFVEKYADHENKICNLYGDPAGRAGEKHGHSSDYTEIKDVLGHNGWEVVDMVQASHPAIKDRQNAVRAKICTAAGDRSLFVNPVTAPWCHEGLATVQLMDGSTYQEDQRNKYQHITTAIGYCIDTLYPTTGEFFAPPVRRA
jgi:hypothetical protein